MFFWLNTRAALVASAAFVFASQLSAQAPIVDASVESGSVRQSQRAPSAVTSPAPASSQNSGLGQGELFYQLQLLQQEVMQLRGLVEEQAFQLRQLKEQSMERYIDLDRRLGDLASGKTVSTGTQTAQATRSGGVEKAARAGEKEAYDAAYRLVINKQFDDALEAFKQFLVDFPDGKYAPNSYYWMGELYQVITPSNLDAAREVFAQLLSQYPDNSKAPDAMYKLGKVYFLLGNKSASREWLEKTITLYGSGSHSSAADKARQFLNANF